MCSIVAGNLKLKQPNSLYKYRQVGLCFVTAVMGGNSCCGLGWLGSVSIVEVYSHAFEIFPRTEEMPFHFRVYISLVLNQRLVNVRV